MDTNYPLTNWIGWAEVVGTARYIVNTTAPGDCCYMSDSCLETIKKLTELTPLQMDFLADALRKAEQLEGEIAHAREEGRA